MNEVVSPDRSEAETVAFVVKDRIAWVKFNRPEKRNCMSPKLNRQMLRVLEDLEFRDDVGVLVLSGEGTAWSAGMDLKEYFRENEAKGLGATRGAQREAYSWWKRLRWYSIHRKISCTPSRQASWIGISSLSCATRGRVRTACRNCMRLPRRWAACKTRDARSRW